MVQINPEFGQAALDAALPVGQEPTTRTFFMDVMENIPPIQASMGNIARRGSNTILYGGRAVGSHSKTWMGQAFKSNLNPLYLNRYGDQSIFFNQNNFFGSGTKGGAGYSPFHLSQIGNSMHRSIGGQSEGRVGSWVGKTFAKTRIGERAAASLERGETPFTQGMWSRISAGARIANMNDKQYGKLLGNQKFDALLNPRAQGIETYLKGAGMNLTPTQLADRRTASLATFASGGRVGGFMGAARHGMSGYMPSPGAAFSPTNIPGAAAFADDVAAVGGNAAGRAGAATASRWAADLNLARGYTAREALRAGASARTAAGAARGAALAGARVGGMALPGVNIAMTAWLVKDLTKMAATGAPHLIGGAVRSYVGDLNTGAFQKQYKDTEAAATSRQRGVMAIQNSRINARSVLGHEGSVMAAHFQ